MTAVTGTGASGDLQRRAPRSRQSRRALRWSAGAQRQALALPSSDVDAPPHASRGEPFNGLRETGPVRVPGSSAPGDTQQLGDLREADESAPRHAASVAGGPDCRSHLSGKGGNVVSGSHLNRKRNDEPRGRGMTQVSATAATPDLPARAPADGHPPSARARLRRRRQVQLLLGGVRLLEAGPREDPQDVRHPRRGEGVAP